MYAAILVSLSRLKVTPLLDTLVRPLVLDFPLITTTWFLPTITVPIFARHTLFLSLSFSLSCRQYGARCLIFSSTPGCGRQRSRRGAAAVDHGGGGYRLPICRPGRGGLRQSQGPRPLADVARRQMPPPQVRYHEPLGQCVAYYTGWGSFGMIVYKSSFLHTLFPHRMASDKIQVLIV